MGPLCWRQVATLFPDGVTRPRTDRGRRLEHLVTRLEHEGHRSGIGAPHGSGVLTAAPSPGLPSTAVLTHCPYCALQCAMTLTPVNGTAVVEAGAGGLCREGRPSA